MKNQILRIIGGIFVLGLYYGANWFVAADHDRVPATPPVTPPTITATITPTTTPTTTPSSTPAPIVEPKDNDGKATGGVSAEWGDLKFRLSFNAHGGEEVKGNINYSDSEGKSVKGNVDVCYVQEGKAAAFAGRVRENDSTKYFLVKVEDNGEGKKSDPDKLGIWFTDSEPSCAVGAFPAFAVNGNLQVH